MSSTIKAAIQALKGRVADAYTAISNKGGTLPATQDSANLPTAIASIPSGDGNEAAIWSNLRLGGSFYMANYSPFKVNATNGIRIADLGSTFRLCAVTEIDIETLPNATSISNAFSQNSNLASIRVGSVTTNLTNAANMAEACANLQSVYIGGTMENCANFNQAFIQCRRITNITLPQIGKIGRACAFQYSFCATASMNIVLLGNMYAGNCNEMFTNSGVVSIAGGQIDLTQCTNCTNMFLNCSALEDILLYGLGVNLNMQSCVRLSYDSLLYMVQNLQNVSGKTLTLGSTNIAKLNATADGQAAITAAQAMGWTIA